MPIRITRGVTPRPRATGALRSPLLTLALAGALIGAAILLFVRFAHWAGAHPVIAVLLALLALPVLYVLFRAMPRARELRRAARAGMVPPAGEEPAPEPAPAPQVLHIPADAHDGLTAVLPPPAPAFTLPDFTALDPDGFEAAVAALCERDGCQEVEVVGGAGDLGADVLATAPDGRRVVVQCKQYGPDHKVGSQDLQRFGGTCWTVHGAQLATVVTTSEFTAPALEYAEACGIRCVDGTALAAWAEGSGAAPWGPAMLDTA
ncbi:restriction endonuclease [Streptomyces sp. CB02460]|uniref:restriction endonuclease n=1 Tax=Streptomyces sp. CB02460 TaxID=1703941 RepID=UPI00093E2E2F|nr:restriction endonuclease [Streptomyces sp. CB02460]OKJ73226.1 translation initiation factor IF-2 [Streptomyces sp. CB02460]